MKYIKFWHVEDVKQRNDHKMNCNARNCRKKLKWAISLLYAKKTQHRDWRYFEMFQTISFETTKGYAVCHLDNSLNVSWSLPDLSRTQTASINSPAVNQKKTVYKVASMYLCVKTVTCPTLRMPKLYKWSVRSHSSFGMSSGWLSESVEGFDVLMCSWKKRHLKLTFFLTEHWFWNYFKYV